MPRDLKAVLVLAGGAKTCGCAANGGKADVWPPSLFKDVAAPGTINACSQGFSGTPGADGSGCQDTDGCAPNHGQGGCVQKSVCADVAAPGLGFTCSCVSGFMSEDFNSNAPDSDGSGCKDIDGCAANGGQGGCVAIKSVRMWLPLEQVLRASARTVLAGCLASMAVVARPMWLIATRATASSQMLQNARVGLKRARLGRTVSLRRVTAAGNRAARILMDLQ